MSDLFVAITVPSQVATQLREKVGVNADLKLVKPTDYHITISFIGRAACLDVERKSIIASLAPPREPIEFTEINAFQDIQPIVLYASVRPSAWLSYMHLRMNEYFGVYTTTQKYPDFKPHVSLARCTTDPCYQNKNLIGKSLQGISFYPSALELLCAPDNQKDGPFVLLKKMKLQ